VETKSERPEPVVPHQVSGKHQCARCNPAYSFGKMASRLHKNVPIRFCRRNTEY
jgi:hypothetical protein